VGNVKSKTCYIQENEVFTLPEQSGRVFYALICLVNRLNRAFERLSDKSGIFYQNTLKDRSKWLFVKTPKKA